MDLQVCHYCGWSKVTTYQGLRIHQGRMGCTPKGVRVAEPQQKYSWDYVGHANTQIDLKLDVRTSFKIEEKTEYSDLSLQVCHCGWSKLTTYQGLRIHQGRVGCTPKGARIPKKEQYDWKNQRDEMEHWNCLPAKKEIVKKENFPELPNTYSCATAGATASFKEEYKLTASVHAQRSSQTVKYQQELPTFPQGAREPSAPPYPGNVVRPEKKKIKQQTLTQMEYSSAMAGYWSVDCYADYATPAIKIKEEPKSPLATPQSSFQRATSRQPREFSTAVAVQQSVRAPPAPPPLEAAVLPMKKNRKRQTRVTGPARKPSAPPYPGSIDTQKGKTIKQPALLQTEDSSAVAGYLRIDRSADCATTAAKMKEKTKSSLTTPHPSFQRAVSSQQQEFSAGVQVKGPVRKAPSTLQLGAAMTNTKTNREDQTQMMSLASDHPTTTHPEAAEQAEEKHRENPSPPPVPPKKNSALFKEMLERFKVELQPKIQMMEEKTCEIRPAETACSPESVPDSANTKSQTGSEAADVPPKENPTLLNEAAEAEGSTGMKVKELARRFGGTTASETVIPPKEKHGAHQKLSQVKLLTQRFSAISAAKEKHREEQKHSQMLTDPTHDATKISSAAAKASLEKDPELSCENAQLSSGLKVKDLARMFSASATQEKAIGSKEKEREQRPAQRVKLLVQKLSARESKDHHKEKDEEAQKPSKWI